MTRAASETATVPTSSPGNLSIPTESRPPVVGVVTTIRAANHAMRRMDGTLRAAGGLLVVVGDALTPPDYGLPSVRFLDLAEQQTFGQLGQRLPTGHYARKNIGYLEAIRRGARCIYETDDDNAPLKSWQVRSARVVARAVRAQQWLNPYRAFTDELVWPRGLPLAQIQQAAPRWVGGEPREVTAWIQQGLANGAPDVDATWRMIFGHELTFTARDSIWVPPRTFCPINSQSTWWFAPAFPLLYLPSSCSMRMTDIWRGLVAQRCLWELDGGLVVHGPEVVQERNPHDLRRDFRDELPGFLHNEAIADGLLGLTLDTGPRHVRDNLRRCYRLLVDGGYLEPVELDYLQTWLDDMDHLESSAG